MSQKFRALFPVVLRPRTVKLDSPCYRERSFGLGCTHDRSNVISNTERQRRQNPVCGSIQSPFLRANKSLI